MGCRVMPGSQPRARTKAKTPKTNGFVERFDGTVLDAFFRVKMRETFCETVEALQADLDAWLIHDNTERPIWAIATRADGPSKPSCHSSAKKVKWTAHGPELPGRLRQPHLATDDFPVPGHGDVLQRRGRAFHPPTVPGPASALISASRRRLSDQVPTSTRLRGRAVADSLEEAGPRLLTFTRLSPGQWKPARTTNAIECLPAEFKRRIKTQTVLPQADTAPMRFRALMASGQIVMREVDGGSTLDQALADPLIDLAA